MDGIFGDAGPYGVQNEYGQDNHQTEYPVKVLIVDPDEQPDHGGIK